MATPTVKDSAIKSKVAQWRQQLEKIAKEMDDVRKGELKSSSYSSFDRDLWSASSSVYEAKSALYKLAKEIGAA